MSKILLYLLLFLLIPGCATCVHREVYKPKVASENKLEVSIVKYTTSVVALLEFEDIASIRVSGCTRSSKNMQICIQAKLDELHSLEMPNAKIEVYSDTMPSLELHMSDWEYWSKEPITPTTATITNKMGFQDYYTFEASALFNGSSSEWDPPTLRLFSKDSRRREFTSITTLPNNIGNKFYLKLPTILLDGKKYVLPILEFNQSNEEFCYHL
jgi:hypothetical protein